MKTLKEDIYGNKITFYHRTRIKELVQNIWTEGFKPGTGDMYGAGCYGTYSLESQDNNPRRDMSDFYGDITIKFAVPSDNFFFFDYDEFLKTPLYKKLKGVTRENYLDKQAQYYGFYNDTHIKENEYTSDSAKYVYKTLTDKKLPNYVSGIVFTGRMDGKVVVVYDIELIIPLTARIGDKNEFKKENLDEGYLRKWLNSTAGKQYINKYREYKYIDMFKKAIDNNDVEKVKELIKWGINPSIDDNLAIQCASKSGRTEIVKLLLADDRVDPSADDNFAIRWASRSGRTEIVKLLLADDRVDPSADDNFAIRYASRNGRTEIVKLLLADDRVDPSANDNFAIRHASENGHTEIVKLLLADDRVDPSVNDNLAIRYASINGHTEIVKLLLADDRVDPSAYDNHAIGKASINGHTEIVKLLLADDRVDPSAYDNYTIRKASEYGHTEVVKLLLQHPKVKESLSKEDYEKYSKTDKENDNINETINIKKSFKKVIIENMDDIIKYIKPYLNEKDIFIHFSNYENHNLSVKEDSIYYPKGLYCYPIKEFYEQVKENGYYYTFGSDRKYMYILKYNGNRIKDVTTFTYEDATNSILDTIDHFNIDEKYASDERFENIIEYDYGIDEYLDLYGTLGINNGECYNYSVIPGYFYIISNETGIDKNKLYYYAITEILKMDGVSDYRGVGGLWYDGTQYGSGEGKGLGESRQVVFLKTDKLTLLNNIQLYENKLKYKITNLLKESIINRLSLYEFKYNRSLKFLKENVDAEEIIFNTLELFGATDDFNKSPFLTPDGEYIGKGDDKKIADKVLKTSNIKSDNPLITYMQRTSVVNIKINEKDAYINILKNSKLTDKQINTIYDMIYNIAGDIFINILDSNGDVFENRQFKIHERNKLKKYLRGLR